MVLREKPHITEVFPQGSLVSVPNTDLGPGPALKEG